MEIKIISKKIYENRCVAALDNHVSVVRGLDVTNDGKYLISGARDKIVSIIDLSNYKVVKSFPVFEVCIK